MLFTPEILPDLIKAVTDVIETNAEEVTVLDQVCGDGDHITNLQRGLAAVAAQSTELAALEWSPALQKLGMTLLSTMGGASGSLFGTLFIMMSKRIVSGNGLDRQVFTEAFYQGVDAVKKRGRSDAGEKTMLDVLIPVANYMQENVQGSVDINDFLQNIEQVAIQGMESTKNMKATKGRASYLGDKTKGHIDAGARTSQLIICSVTHQLQVKIS